MAPAFKIGLNLPGAVSAGAYTAGVVDFLIEALDAFYRARAVQQMRHGNDYEAWEIPSHRVELAAICGASAGGMVGAITAAALCQDFTHVHGPNAPTSTFNPLYRSWVSDIDATWLLGSRDLSDPNAAVVSILDSTRVSEIAQEAIQVPRPRAVPREWVSRELRITTTLTNLNGIPYAIEGARGATQTQALYHADQRDFVLTTGEAKQDATALTLNPGSPENWGHLAAAAAATGAFPLMLAPRTLSRTAGEYNRREWSLCDCGDSATILPNWPARNDDGRVFETLNVDGGVTNNSPFDRVSNVLSQLDPKQPGPISNSPLDVDRAVVSVAPFLSSPIYDMDILPGQSLLSQAGQLLGTVIAQSRVQGENIQFTGDSGIYNRYVVAPSIDLTTVGALACGTLRAFGGFLAREFRDHDYQLGRRNCQRFLDRHLALPANNIVMQSNARMADEFGVALEDGTRAVQLIPLLGDLQSEIVVDRAGAAIEHERLDGIAAAAVERLKLVATRLASEHHGGWCTHVGIETLFLLGRGTLRQKLNAWMTAGLSSQGFLK